MRDEISALLADVKEQILYLQELGAENLAVDLPEISFAPVSHTQIPRKTGSLKFRSSDWKDLCLTKRF
jgi:hypothetical protein